MPTGYTAAVQDGTITTFPDFALSCARAFGALIMMRDEPTGKAIPDRFEPELEYYDRALANASKRLDLTSMDAGQIALAYIAANTAEEERRLAANEIISVRAGRYRAMMLMVEAWTPPGKDHVELKEFMLEQLQTSLDCDCGAARDRDTPLSQEEWFKQQVTGAERDRDYYTAERVKEIERTEARNCWIADLRKSLVDEGAAEPA